MEIGFEQKQIKNLQPYIVPIGTIIGMVLLTLIMANHFFGKVTDLMADRADAVDQREILSDRLDILRTNQVELEETQDIVRTALPSTNSSVLVLQHLFEMANTYQIVIEDLSLYNESAAVVAQQQESPIHNVVINFTIIGEYEGISNYIAKLKEISPIVSLTTIGVENRLGIKEAKLTLRTFFSEAPETIPAITSKLEDLEDTEKQTVNVIKDYELPTLIQRGVPAPSEGKDNPFLLQTGI